MHLILVSKPSKALIGKNSVQFKLLDTSIVKRNKTLNRDVSNCTLTYTLLLFVNIVEYQIIHTLMVTHLWMNRHEKVSLSRRCVLFFSEP
jgi:hypothetical protein